MDQVLLVEDNFKWAETLADLLQQLNVAVTWITGGVPAKNGTDIEAIFADSPVGQTVSLSVRQYKVALLDGDLAEGTSGLQLIPALVQSGCIVIAMSDYPPSNAKMQQVGGDKVLICEKQMLVTPETLSNYLKTALAM